MISNMVNRSKFLALFILAVFLVTSGFGCKSDVVDNYETITLNFWGVWDTPAQMNTLISAYQASHPTIKVEYKNFRFDEYEQKLNEALWDDRLPDVFAIPATWLKDYQDRLEPMPSKVKIPVKAMLARVNKFIL